MVVSLVALVSNTNHTANGCSYRCQLEKPAAFDRPMRRNGKRSLVRPIRRRVDFLPMTSEVEPQGE
jgi:hypothetical protein